MSAELIRFFENQGHPKILVVGDLMLDRYLWGSVDRISPEAPIPVIRIQREEDRPGGAGCVALGLRALGAEVYLASAVGDDADGRSLMTSLEKRGIDVRCVQLVRGRPTTTKSRLIARDQHVLRVDREETGPYSPAAAAGFLAGCRGLLAEVSCVVISDYDKGLLAKSVVESLMAMANEAGLPSIVDPRRGGDYGRYRGCSGMTPNRKEAYEATGIEPNSPENFEACAQSLIERCDLRFAIITLDKDGMYLKLKGQPGRRFPTRARQVYDVSGAGDQVLASLGYTMAGYPNWESREVLEPGVRLANVAAGLEVQKLGAVPVEREELLQELRGDLRLSAGKLCTPAEAKAARENLSSQGRRLVFTNGCFDILHPGHVSYLEYARSLGDALMVGVNADASIRRLKGPERPVNGLDARMRLLAGLACVDHVVSFEQDTPLQLIQEIKPDILVKGEDWKDKGVVGADVLASYGGEVVLAPLLQGFSTTRLVEKIRDAKTC